MSKGEKRPRTEAIAIAEKLLGELTFTDAMICGSIRRERAMVGDIDIAISVTEKERIYLNATLYRLFGSVKSKGGRGSRNGEYKYGDYDSIQVNILDVLPSQFGAAVLMSTGSGDFNIMMRRRAKDRGLSLSQYGLVNCHGHPICDCSTEDIIFAALGMDYVEPFERNV